MYNLLKQIIFAFWIPQNDCCSLTDGAGPFPLTSLLHNHDSPVAQKKQTKHWM